MSETFRNAVEQAVGERVTALERLAGGDINDAYRATLAGGTRIFVKTRKHAPAGMYEREAEGLAWLAEADALRTPQVIAANDQLLALSFIERGTPARDFDAQLGRGLALLHRAGAPSFGFVHDNFIGDLPQHNAPLSRWSDFYRERRLEPLLTRARAQGRLGREHTQAFERLYARLDRLVGDCEPARLHGDLWSGNVHVGPDGAPVLLDPSAYGGHREVDLAMLALFGSPSPNLFAAYDEVWPRAAGHAERVALYQLYPLLVHVNLFAHAHGYVKLLEKTLAFYA